VELFIRTEIQKLYTFSGIRHVPSFLRRLSLVETYFKSMQQPLIVTKKREVLWGVGK